MVTAAPAGLVFEPLMHAYFYDGKPVPSVTQVIERVGLADFSAIPERIREAALARGRRVHAAAQFLTEGALDWDTVDELDKGYVEAAAAFLAQASFTVLDQERRIYHPALRYAGTTDIIGLWHGERAVGDYCTGDTWEACKDLQTSAYAEALRVVPPDCWWEFDHHAPIARVGIRLHKDGRYSAAPYKNPMDFRVFQAAVAVVHEQLRRGKKGVAA